MSKLSLIICYLIIAGSFVSGFHDSIVESDFFRCYIFLLKLTKKDLFAGDAKFSPYDINEMDKCYLRYRLGTAIKLDASRSEENETIEKTEKRYRPPSFKWGRK